MALVEVRSLNDQVVLIIAPHGDHKQQFIGYGIRGAHELVTEILEAINSAQGHEDAMAGRVTPPMCPLCKSRNIMPGHECRTPRTGKRK